MVAVSMSGMSALGVSVGIDVTTLLYWLVASAAAFTAVTYTITMFAFFRPRAGSAKRRLMLLFSVSAANIVLAVGIANRTMISVNEGTIGLLLLVGSHGLFWWAVWAHGRGRPSGAFAIEPPPLLVLVGPYRYIRHPFYVAYLQGFVAGAIFVGEWWAWVVPAWMALMYWVAARHEEGVILSSPLGSQYRHYAQHVGGFVPRFRRWTDPVG